MNETIRRLYELQVKLSADSLAALRKIQDHAGGIEKAFSKAQGVIAEFGKGLVAGLTIGAFVQQITSATAAIDELAKQAERLSMPVEEFTALAHAANIADVQMEELSGGLKELQKSITEFQDKGSKARGIFDALGIDPTGKSTTQVLEELADAMKGIQDPALRSRTMLELFGKAGLAMVPLLNKGAEGIRELREEAERLGVSFGEETANRQQRFEEALKRMGAASDALKRNFVDGLLPAMSQIVEAFNKTTGSAERWKAAGEVIGNVLKGLSVIAFTVVESFGTLGRMLGAFLAAQEAIRNLDFRAAINIVREFGSDTGDAVKRVKEFTTELFNSIPAQKEAAAAVERNAKAEGELNKLYGDTNKKRKERNELDDAHVQAWRKLNELRQREIDQLTSGTAIKQTEELLRKVDLLNAAFFDGAIGPELYKQAIDLLTGSMEKVGKEAETLTIIVQKSSADLSDMESLLKEIAEKVDGYSQRISGIFVDWATGAGNAKTSFADMATDILRQLAQMTLQMLVFDKFVKQVAQTIAGWNFGSLDMGQMVGRGMMAANGAVFAGGDVIPFARGGIVRGPTLFPMARGMGLMGEAGPEAVMPLGRTSSGELGVKGGGVVVNIINNTPAKVTAKEERTSTGGQTITVMVENAIENGFASGRFDKVMQGTYGLARTGRT